LGIWKANEFVMKFEKKTLISIAKISPLTILHIKLNKNVQII